MKKIKILFIVFAGLIFIYLIFQFFSTGSISTGLNNEAVETETPISTETSQNFTLIVDSGSNDPLTLEYSETEDLTAYDLLLRAKEEGRVQFDVTEYDFGIFVSSINGVESSDDMAWIYFVNGESAQVAADQYQLESGDIVEWKYITPSEE